MHICRFHEVIMICGIKDLPVTSATHCISIVPEEIEIGIPHIKLRFDDTIDETSPARPTMAHIEEALAYADALPSDARLVVHCTAGLSRSAALVVAILVDRGMDYFDALDQIKRIRPESVPNSLMLDLIKERLGLRLN